MAGVDLVFGRAPTASTPPVDLVFGESEAIDAGFALTLAATLPALSVSIAATTVAPPNYDLVLAATLPALTVSITATAAAPAYSAVLGATLPALTVAIDATFAMPAYDLVLAATLPALTVSVAGTFDIDIPNWLQAHAGSPWRQGSAAAARAGGRWHNAANQAARAGLPWAQGTAIAAHRDTRWRDAAALRVPAAAVPWRDAAPLRTKPPRLPWRDAARLRPNPTAAPWRQALPLGTARRTLWRDGVFTPVQARQPWRDAQRLDRHRRLPWHQGALNPGRKRVPWHDGLFVISHGGAAIVIVAPPTVTEPCYTPPPGSAVHLLFGDAPGTTDLVFWCENHPYGPPAAVAVPIKKVYLVLNDTHLVKTAGAIELPTLGMQLTLDASSWTWGFSATLPASELSRVLPASDGTPVELAAIINGVTYLMLAESVARDRSFGVATIRISGRGKNAVLDVPYAPVQAFGNTAARTIAQLLDDALTVNGVGIGWSVDNGIADDWLVPAGVWSVQGSHIAAVTGIAAAAGAYVQPHATDDTLIVLPRYPSAPWNWGGVTPDYELPSSVTTQEGISWVEKARYNRVFVSGQGQGVLGQVTRAGTAGDVVAPMVTDALITAAAGARQRGLPVLADTGRIATVSLRLPVLSATGLIRPGKFVRYVDGATSRFGIVRSMSLDVGHPEMWQTIGVETHE